MGQEAHPWEPLLAALAQGERRLAEAATQSARWNQAVLPKDALEALLQEARACGALGLVAAVVITVILRRTRGQPRFCLALAMILGGAIGNVVDRMLHGHVVDFLLFYWQNWYYPAFNVADSFICVGAVLLVIDGFKHKKDKAV